MITLKDVSRIFVWGFDGYEVSSPLNSLFKETPPAGVILFKRNIESLSQVKRLNHAIKKLSHKPLLISVDQEGGRVARLTSPFPTYPPAATWGFLYDRGRNRKMIVEAGFLLGKELKALGFNLDFAPVLDVNSNPQNPIIGDRAFSENPKTVADVALAFAEGMKKAGIIACGKHFPGHGDTNQDSHLTLPTVTRSRVVLQKTEMVPFQQAVKKKIPMLMTAHVVYPALDPENPATLSSKILTNILRKKWKYQGVIISDDLEMKAVSEKYSFEESAILSLQAGVDIILICKGGESGSEVVEKVYRQVQKSPFLQQRVLESLQRIKGVFRP